MDARLFAFLLAVLAFPFTGHTQAPGDSRHPEAAAPQAYNPAIDVQHYDFSLRLDDGNDRIKGEAAVTLTFLQDVSSFHLDLVKKNAAGKGMLVRKVRENATPVPFPQEGDWLVLHTPGKKGSLHKYIIVYEGIPADGLIISTNKYGH